MTVLKGAFDASTLRPFDPNVDNLIDAGRVLPIKLRVTCENIVVDDVTVTIDAIETLPDAGTPISNEVIDAPGMSRDEGNVFKFADDEYRFILATADWGDGAGVRHRVTVRVERVGPVDTFREICFVDE